MVLRHKLLSYYHFYRPFKYFNKSCKRERGVEWSNDQHPLPEHVFDVYMQYWGSANLN